MRFSDRGVDLRGHWNAATRVFVAAFQARASEGLPFKLSNGDYPSTWIASSDFGAR
jgi:hypothetical protein